MAKKKRYMVVARSKQAAVNGIDTSRGHRDFTNNSALYVTDPSEAKEIDQRYGRKGTMDAYVTEDVQYERALNGESWDVKGNDVKLLHNYHFGSTQSYAEAWEAFEKRRLHKKRKQKAAEEAEVENGKETSGVRESPGEHSEEAGDQQEAGRGNISQRDEEGQPSS